MTSSSSSISSWSDAFDEETTTEEETTEDEEEESSNSDDEYDYDFYERQRRRKRKKEEMAGNSTKYFYGKKGKEKLSANRSRKVVRRLCMICMERKPYTEIFRNKNCRCGKMYCSKCIRKHITTKLKENISSINCPSMNCRVVLQPKLCQQIIPKQVFDQWKNKLWESSVVSRGLKYEYDSMTMELAKKKKWQRCPGCKFYVEKREGCLHITCRCRCEFCYRCGAKWTTNHGGCS